MKQRTESRTKKMGILAASGVVISQGFEAVLLPLLFYASFMFTISEMNGIAYSAGIMSIKELISLFLIFAYLGHKVIIKSIKLMLQKRNFGFILAGFFGTSMGNLFFIVGIVLAGPSYGVILTAFYPVFAIAMNKIIYRDKDNWLSKIGILFSVLSGALFVILPVIIGGGSITSKTIAGMCCGLLAGFFWALEGLLLRKSMDKNPDVTQKEVIAIRTIMVVLTTWIVFVPISIGINNGITHHSFNTYNELYGRLFTNKDAVIVWTILFIAGLNILLMRIMHTNAIEMIGQKLTAIIDTNNFIIPSIFALVLQNLPGIPGTQFKDSLLEWYLWLLLIPLSLGLILVLVFHGKQEIQCFKRIFKDKSNKK